MKWWLCWNFSFCCLHIFPCEFHLIRFRSNGLSKLSFDLKNSQYILFIYMGNCFCAANMVLLTVNWWVASLVPLFLTWKPLILSMLCFLLYLGSCKNYWLFLIIIQVWGTLIMQKKYQGRDYMLAFLVTLGCSVFILYPVITVVLFSNSYSDVSRLFFSFFLF